MLLRLLSTFGISLLANSAFAVNFFVTTGADLPDLTPGDGVCAVAGGGCSLRAAIQEANAQPGTDVIVLAENTTYALTRSGINEDDSLTGDLDISESLEIRGAAPGSSVLDGSSLDRVLDVAPLILVRISNVTIRGGVVEGSGGAVRNRGVLFLERVSFEGNRANRGGAILNAGALYSSKVAYIGNSAVLGGGAIFNQGTEEFPAEAVVINSTFSGNVTAGSGGAISSVSDSYIAVVHSTLVGNQADMMPSATSITLPTTGEGGGTHRGGNAEFVISNSIIYGNIDGNRSGIGSLVTECAGVYDEISSSIIGSLAGCSSPNEIDLLVGVDPLLTFIPSSGGVLAHYVPDVASQAVDQAAEEDCPPVDQKGVLRPIDGDASGGPQCDIGAIELGLDCNRNLVFDGADISSGTSKDRNNNLTPDECELDTDGDGIPDDIDNCVTVANPDQENDDGDIYGNVCEPDSDKDGVPDDTDLCPADPLKFEPMICGCGVVDLDENGNGIPDCLIRIDLAYSLDQIIVILDRLQAQGVQISDKRELFSLLTELQTQALESGMEEIKVLAAKVTTKVKKALRAPKKGKKKAWKRVNRAIKKISYLIDGL